jgi:GrpB-like predicted nucleotidyltransferase (UPF0157 family)
MKIYPFDENLAHRTLLPYNPVYRELFLEIREHVRARLPAAELIHIGSTAVADLRGKPMLDIVVLTVDQDLRQLQRQLEQLGFHRRDVWVDRDDKPYLAGSVRRHGATFNVNLHLCHPGDPVHVDSIAFMAILNRRPDLRRVYERAKDRAHGIDPSNPEVYNREKEAAILEIQRARSPSVNGNGTRTTSPKL